METEFNDLPIFNDDLEHIFEKETNEEFNDSIFLANDFEEIQQTDDIESQNSKSGMNDLKMARNIRKDDFDYNAYIKEEMKNYDTDTMPENLKKHVIQKIRNRMSAQRSRQRQKNMQECMDKENKTLKAKNTELKKQVLILKEENQELRLRVLVLERSKTAECSSEEEKTNSEISEVYRDQNQHKSNFGFNKIHVFLFLAIVCVFLVPSGITFENPVIKMGGVVPMISSFLPVNSRQLKSIDDICRSHCQKQSGAYEHKFDHPEIYLNKIKSFEHKTETEKQIELFANTRKLVCFDPESRLETENVYRIIVNSGTLNNLNSEDLFYGQFHKLVSE